MHHSYFYALAFIPVNWHKAQVKDMGNAVAGDFTHIQARSNTHAGLEADDE